MEKNPNLSLPTSYTQFSGQLDDASCVCFRLANHAIRPAERYQSLANPISAAVYNTPLAVTVSHTLTQVQLHCRMLCASQLEICEDETSVFLQCHKSLNSLKFLRERVPVGASIIGANELTQVIERTVPLPARIVPSTRTVEIAGQLVVIRYQVKMFEPKKVDLSAFALPPVVPNSL